MYAQIVYENAKHYRSVGQKLMRFYFILVHRMIVLVLLDKDNEHI